MPHSLKPGDEIVPGYVLVRRLGAGGSGEVWVSRASGGVQVAIKILSDLAMIASDRELEALRIVREAKHPNLCPLFGVWFFDDEHNLLSSKETESILGTGDDLTETVCLAPTEQRESSAEFDPPITETVALSTRKTKPTQMIVAMGLGEQTLMDRLVQVLAEKEAPVADPAGDDAATVKTATVNAATGDAATGDAQPVGIEPVELLRYMKSAASAIDELNERHNIYHCDIKPQNILLVGGQAQVCDFGLARKVEDSRKTSVAFGTPAYGAPEMLFERTYSKTIDQYSLAVTYYELRTGRLPYSSLTQSSLLRSKATGEVDLSRVPPAEKLVLSKAID
ncbi:MAG: protein kinase, partial [Pirellulaceae bacterium]|nr:protein kinase [Pirellulaceae bacterium]